MRASSVVLTLLLALTGCAGAGGDDLDGAEEDLGGMGVPQQLDGEEYPGPRGDLTVRLVLAGNGCFLGTTAQEPEPRLLVWPRGTEQGDHGDELRLPGGAIVRHGDVLSGRGLLLPTDRLPAVAEDGYWAYAVGFCTPDAATVLVLDRAVPRS